MPIKTIYLSILLCFIAYFPMQAQQTLEDSLYREIENKIKTFSQAWERKICENIFSQTKGEHLLMLNSSNLKAHNFYDTLFIENSYTFVITNSCGIMPYCNLTLFVFDKNYDLITTFETHTGRSSRPSFQVKNIVADKDIEILVTTPDNPGASTFEDITVQALKFNDATKKIVAIFEETTYNLSFVYECSRIKMEVDYRKGQIYVKEAYTKLLCDDYIDRHKLKELLPTVITNYTYVWNKKAFKFVRK
jgi:hypothetical protein